MLGSGGGSSFSFVGFRLRKNAFIVMPVIEIAVKMRACTGDTNVIFRNVWYVKCAYNIFNKIRVPSQRNPRIPRRLM